MNTKYENEIQVKIITLNNI